MCWATPWWGRCMTWWQSSGCCGSMQHGSQTAPLLSLRSVHGGTGWNTCCWGKQAATNARHHGWNPSTQRSAAAPSPGVRRGCGKAMVAPQECSPEKEAEARVIPKQPWVPEGQIRTWQGFWKAALVLGVAGDSFWFAKEIGLVLSPLLPQIALLLLKTLFLPHQPLFYACVWQQVAESHPVQ